MTNSPSKPPHPGATAAPRPRTAAQRASDANKLQQRAVRDNTSRPNDRRSPDAGRHDQQSGMPPSWKNKH
ncbi:MAG TPA: hypothetical protein VFV70_12735 [Hyphomonadaceae bacterium]|nr:hypothetical protein [Hyphomonadaceae bacterium]